jgi:sigma-B regulation protein RsbU (phosphoserine phosphatase)
MPDHSIRTALWHKLIETVVPTTRMGRLMLIGLLVWFISWTFSRGGTLFGSAWLKIIFDVGSVLAFIPLTYFLVKGVRWFVRHLLWRLRRRLVITYLLIGVLPLALVIALVALIGYAVIVQSSSDLVARQLDGYLEQSQAAAQAISRDLREAELSRLEANPLRRQLRSRAEALAPIFPGLTLTVRRGGDQPFTVSVTATSFEDEGRNHAFSRPELQDVDAAAPLPPWVSQRQDFHGLTFDEDATGGRQVSARHIIKLTDPAPLMLELSYPVGAELGKHLSHTTGLTVLPGQAVLRVHRSPSGDLVIEGASAVEMSLSSRGGEARVTREQRGREVEEALKGFPILMPITDWRTGRQLESDALFVDFSFLRLDQIFKRLDQFRTGSAIGELWLTLIASLGGVFLVLALMAVVSAVFLTRSITGAIHHLYQGTKRVEAGDLEHEIPIYGRDQLGALSRSFNQMTRSVRELLRVSAEKQRLDQEMRIAAEVQARLFPRAIPKTKALDLAPGICIPARAVSGDYYDFLEVAPGVIGLVVADVCGKGMSAALLMANLQANLRGQVQAYRDAYQARLRAAMAQAEAADEGNRQSLARLREQFLPQHPVKQVVERANRQIEASMMDATYVTLFYAEFDERTSVLRYTNAGHNPPLLLRSGHNGRSKIERLDCGGTVIGLFAEIEYEEATVELERGDVLAAFTDGLIEARSPQGQEFGEERVISLLHHYAHLPAIEIEHLILQAVKSWTGGAEQEDDLTLVLFKVN